MALPGALGAASREWSWLLAVLAGTALRLDQIGTQIPLDDEWHALHAVERFDYVHVLTHFGWTDYCIPLTLFDKLVSDTVGLSEPWLRLPVLAAGILSLVAMPLMARPWLGREGASLFAWLLAISPLHVYLSRYARPYSIALLLTFLALFALLHVRPSGRPVWAAAYVAGAVLSPYFHLTTLPIVLLPFGLAWLARLRDPAASLSSRTLWIIGLSVASGLLALLGPPLVADHRALLYKAGGGTPTMATFVGAAQLFAGSARPAALVVMAAAAGIGSIALARRHPGLVAGLALVIVVALGVPVLTHPVLAELPIVLARYALVVLPLLLLLAASGFAALASRAGARAPLVAGVMGPALGTVLALQGPLPRTHWRPNAWTNHPAFQYSYAADPCTSREPVPPFYERLALLPPGSVRVVEAPWLFSATGIRFHCYQRVHRQHMFVGFVGGVFDGRGGGGLPRPGELPVLARPDNYHLRSFVHLDAHSEMLRRGIRFVILHKAIGMEMAGNPRDASLGIEPWIVRYRERHGAPAYEDADVVVFDVGG